MIQQRRVVYLDNATWTRLKDESAATKRTISDIVREACTVTLDATTRCIFPPLTEQKGFNARIDAEIERLADIPKDASPIARMTQAQRDKILKGK